MELDFLSRRISLPDIDPPELASPPKRSPIESSSVLLTIAPSFTMALPMLLGFYLMYQSNSYGMHYMTMGLTTAVGSALLGTVWGTLNCRRRTLKMRFNERLRKRSYRKYLQDFEAKIKEEINYLENIYRNHDPDPKEWIDTARERVCCSREEPDPAIRLRLGLGEIPYPIRMEQSGGFAKNRDILGREAELLQKKYSRLKRVPICVDLIGQDELTLLSRRASDLYHLVTLLLVRCALTYQERAVKILLDTEDKLLRERTEWTAFLPHLISETDAGSLPEDVYLLIFTDQASLSKEFLQHPNRILVRLKMHSGDQSGPAGSTTAMITEQFTGLVLADGKRVVLDFDRIGQREAELAARALCRLKKEPGDEEGIPDVYPILSMLQEESVSIAENWARSDTRSSLRVPLGIAANRQIIYLDAHDKRDGPHGLIAGMTGSGKSELLMTYILSLSVRYPPWEVAFFLIDYKGGGMSAAFAGLPHVIGSISNLSGHTIERAFLSIRSENERRQRLFLQNGVNHISDYHRKYAEEDGLEALPHIFLIVDEFAQLKAEEPDFMQELIALSRVGRSLGIHLLLCTQKPSGSVDNTIMTNARFQIALRLQDPLDSKEVLRHPDAADLKNPGRAILRVGNDEVYETFQCAYALSPAAEAKKRCVYPADRFGRRLPEADLMQEEDGAGCTQTAMDLLLAEIRSCAEEVCRAEPQDPYGSVIRKSRKVRSLWLPELPEILTREKLRGYLKGRLADNSSGHGSCAADGADGIMAGSLGTGVLVGLWDDPVNVLQGPLYLDHRMGHHLICGMPRSGKSVFLKTYLTGLLCQPYHPQVFVCDLGGGLLSSFAERKQGVTCLSEEAVQEIPALLSELHAHEKDAVLILDGLSVLLAECPGASELLLKLLRDGIRKQISVIISANGIGLGEMSQTMLTYMDRCFCLRMQDKFRYAEILRDPHFKGSTGLGPGRGYVRRGEQIVSFMTMTDADGRVK
ncbi:MAG: hypothetical protein J5518_04025 [Lachnospiraceae bacterium]|nr:hypothetical protein [Lachnospiraceae bacterium]